MWEQLDNVSLADEFAHDVPTTQEAPFVIRKDYTRLQSYALQHFYDTHTDAAFEERDQERAFKLHLLLSRMLLARLDQHGHEGSAILQDRVRRCYRGDWLSLLRDAERLATARAVPRRPAPPGAARARQ